MDFCLPSLGLTPFWNLVSLIVNCGPSGRGTPGILGLLCPIIGFFLWFIRAPGFLEPCLPPVVHQGAGTGFRDSWIPIIVILLDLSPEFHCLPDSCGTLSPIIVIFLGLRAPGFLEIPNSRACWVSISRAGAGSRGLAAFKIRNGTLELEPWNPGTLELEPWNPGTLEPWNPGTLEPWNPGT